MRATVLSALAAAIAPAAAAHQYEFVDVTAEVGLEVPLTLPWGGIAVGDVDGDGWLDIALFGAADPRPLIFRNHGGLIAAGQGVRRFGDVTPYVMPRNSGPTSMGLFGDLDNDGDHDMVVVARQEYVGLPLGDDGDTTIRYYENTGGRFRRGLLHPDLGRGPRLGGLSLGDTDRDGDLDIVFQHNGNGGGTGGPGCFVRNDGLPNLVDATASFGAGLGDWRRNFSTLLADFDGDGWLDLHTAVDFHSDYHCRNLGNGSFELVSAQVGTTNGGSDMGVAVGDIENDGDLDIYSTNIGIGVLYVNDGTGHFSNDATSHGVASWGFPPPTGWGTIFGDFDNDRDQDLVFVAYGAPGFFYENDGQGQFTKRIGANLGLDLLAHGVMGFDYDKDGDLDLLVLPRSGSETPRLYENRSPGLVGRHWLVVDPVGIYSNRDGVGARIEVTVGAETMTRVVMAGESFHCGPPMLAHFGLGDAAVADEVRVTWPSGIVQVLEDVAGDRYLEVVEGVTR